MRVKLLANGKNYTIGSYGCLGCGSIVVKEWSTAKRNLIFCQKHCEDKKLAEYEAQRNEQP